MLSFRGTRRIVLLLAMVVTVQLGMLGLYGNSAVTYDRVTGLSANGTVEEALKAVLGASNDVGSARTIKRRSRIHQVLTDLLDTVFQDSDFNSNWRLFTKLHFKDVVTDPSFYQHQRKDFHMYDPRITMSVYLSHIADSGKDSQVPFSWQDWVDLSVVNDFLKWDESVRPTCEEFLKHGLSYDPLKAIERPSPLRYSSYCIDNDAYEGHTSRHLLPGFSFTASAGSNFNYIEKRLHSRSYLLSMMPQPEKLVFLSQSNDIFEVDVNHTSHTTMMENGMFDAFVKSQSQNSKLVNFDPALQLQNVASILSPVEPIIDFRRALNATHRFEYTVPKSSFRLNAPELLLELGNNYDSLTRAQQVFVRNLEHQLKTITKENAPKAFSEVDIDDHQFNGHKVANTGHHYDLRFFNGFVSESKSSFFDNVEEKKMIILHQLLHTWLHFSFNAGFLSFPSHGSLLAWYWNSLVFPWDSDVDVILPVMDLTNLCMNYNNSLIVQSPTDGFGKYYLDCSSSLIVREHGNGANNIDARLIDVDSGMYIDLTGLAVSADTGMTSERRDHFRIENISKEPDADLYKIHGDRELYNCRNSHFYSHRELSPLRLTMMEHAPAFVPSNMKEMVEPEYGHQALHSIAHQNHIFVQALQLWVSDQLIFKVGLRIDPSLGTSDVSLLQFYQQNKEAIVDHLLADEDILVELTQVSFQTRAHELEQKLHDKIYSQWNWDNPQDKRDYFALRDQYAKLMQEYLKHHAPMRKSPLDYTLEVEMLQLNMELDFTRDEVSKFV